MVQTPGRTLGMADYSSRHPSHCNGTSIKLEEMFRDRFTINVVEEFTGGLEKTLLTNFKTFETKRANQIARKPER